MNTTLVQRLATIGWGVASLVYIEGLSKINASAELVFDPILTAQYMTGEVVKFHVPSKNISCRYGSFGSTAGLSCDVFSRAWKDWDVEHAGIKGTRFGIDETGPASAVRSSDIMGKSWGFTLQYGSEISLGSISCKSETIGLTCTNKTGGLMHLNREFFVLNKPVPR